MKNHLLAATAAALLASGIARADWPLVHYAPGNNALVAGNATITDLAPAPEWNTGPQDLQTSSRAVIAGGLLYAVATQSSPDRVWIKSFDLADGQLENESGNLDEGVSVSFGTASSPSIDTVAGALFFGTGDTVYRLKTSDLTEDWNTVLSASNTSAAPEAVYTILNVSPALGDGRVYLRTYPTSFGSVEGSQVVALNAATGAVDWYAVTGGRGASSPLYLEVGTDKFVVAEAMSVNTTVELVAFDATSTGAATPAWTISAPLAAPSTGGASNHGQWGDFIYDSASEKIFGITSNFSGGRLYRVDAATGTLDWQVDVPGSDIPPILVGTELLVLDAFNQLSRYSIADGSAIGTPAVITSSFIFRDYVAARADGLYFAKSGEGLRLIDFSGVTQSTTAALDYTGPVTVDDTTGFVYTFRADGSLSSFTGTTNVRNWIDFE